MKQTNDHYVPQFYLKRWSQNNPNQKLASGRFIQATGKFQWEQHAPSRTGYECGLYGQIEEKFFKPLDNEACNVLSRLESGQSERIVCPIKLDLGEKDHDRWAEFILGFIIRMPDKVKFIKACFKNKGLDESIAINSIPNIIQNKGAIKNLRSLTWIFAQVNTNLELITCDNPLIFSVGSGLHPEPAIY